jgi:deazaflavin-dependent oxidoreductase (nitroreductase family)
VAHPRVELQDGPERREYTVRLAEGDEREAWWERAVSVWPAYAQYQTRTDRQIPVFVAEPA